MHVRALLFMMVLSLPARAQSIEDALVDREVDSEDLPRRPIVELPRGHGTRSAVLPEPRGSAWVSLVGFRDSVQTGGFLVVGLPFDRMARGSTRTTLPMELVHSPDGPFDLSLSPRFARATVDAAWRAAGLGPDEARLDAIVSRAHWSATLPETRLRAVRYDDALLSLDTTTGDDPSRLHDSTRANVGLEARVTWRLDRLLYADDEPAFERIRLEHRDHRARVATHVLQALFNWQRSLLDYRSMPPSQHGTRDEADLFLRVLEAETTLDVLTNGWFSANKPRTP